MVTIRFIFIGKILIVLNGIYIYFFLQTKESIVMINTFSKRKKSGDAEDRFRLRSLSIVAYCKRTASALL